MPDSYDDAVQAILACIKINGSRIVTSISAIDTILRTRFMPKEPTPVAERAKGFAKTPPVIHLPVNYDWPQDRLRRAEAEIAELHEKLAVAQSSNSGSVCSMTPDAPESAITSPGGSKSK